MTKTRPAGTHSMRRPVRVFPAFIRDHTQQAAGSAYTLAQQIAGLADAEMAQILFADRTTWNRKRRGAMPSAKSKSRAEILRIGEAGADPMPLVADDFAAALQAMIAPLDTPALRLLRRQTYHREQAANGKLDRLQMAFLDDQPVDPVEMRAAKLEQAAFTLLLIAAQDELTLRRES